MGKKSIKTAEQVEPLFSEFKSYSVAEILAAGGTTAFANKLGKHPELIGEKFKELPDDAFLTDEEVTLALKMLRENK
ncbi:hypothetical protein [uncultured Mucilaginibacter sp.]|uniref:hypothetical protein n=1 Tax=uncultured Mucilaginibacter sp. TaxID=797541 RepID=UPI00261E1A6C|nr:hypothetical protein [uncultured Mucilaginibacter sp.]